MPLDPGMTVVVDEGVKEFSTTWSLKVHNLVLILPENELAEFPDLKIIDEVHTLIFNATRELVEAPDLSLTDAISACGRRLRGIRLGLSTIHDIKPPFPHAFQEALQQAHGNDGSDGDWGKFDPKEPLEVHLGDILMKEYEGMLLMLHTGMEASFLAHQLEYTLKKWRDEAYRKKVMKRLDEIGVVDFNPDDLHSRLLHLLSEFYLKHPEGIAHEQRGIDLLKEIVAFDKQDFGALWCWANINLKEGFDMAKRVIDRAVDAGSQFNAARLEMCCAKSMMNGARGPAFSKQQTEYLINGAKSRLDKSKFWLPRRKYELYSSMLRSYEAKMNAEHVTPEEACIQQHGGFDFRNRPLSDLTAMLEQAGISVPEPKTPLKECAHCQKDSSETMPLCSGCGEVYYCSKKCEKEDRPNHREHCKRKQAKLADGKEPSGSK